MTGTNESSVQVVLVHLELPQRRKSSFLTQEADEQLRMNDCYYDKKDWRACKFEVR